MEKVDVDALDRLFGRYTPEIIRTISLLSGDDATVAKEHLAHLRRQAEVSGRTDDGKIPDGPNRPVSPEELVQSLRRDLRSRLRRGSDVHARPTGSPSETRMPRQSPHESSLHEQERSGGFSDGLTSQMRPCSRAPLGGFSSAFSSGPSSAFSSGPISMRTAISSRDAPGNDDNDFPFRKSRRAERAALHFETVSPPPLLPGDGPSVDSPGLRTSLRSQVLGTRRTASDRHELPTGRKQSDPIAAQHLYYAKSSSSPHWSLTDEREGQPASIPRRDSPVTIPSEVQLQMAIEMSLGEQERRLSLYNARRGAGAAPPPPSGRGRTRTALGEADSHASSVAKGG